MSKFALILVYLIIFINGCQKASETKAGGTEPVQAGEGLPVEYKSLSDVQVTSCNAAHEAGTCDTRLADVGIVLKEYCCEVLGKCF